MASATGLGSCTSSPPRPEQALRFGAVATSLVAITFLGACGGGGENEGRQEAETGPPTGVQTTPAQLDTALLERRLLKRMDRFGSADWRVQCPRSVPVQKGRSFECTVTGPSEWRWTITQEDAEGNRVATKGELTKAAAGTGFQGRIVVRGSEELQGDE